METLIDGEDLQSRRKFTTPKWYWVVTAVLVVIIAVTAVPALTEHAESPGINDFFPPVFLGEGTPFAINRLVVIRFIMAIFLCLIFALSASRLRIVPSRFQQIMESAAIFVRDQIAIPMLGETKGKQYAPLIGVIFFGVLVMNIAGIIPGMNIAASSVMSVPLVFAILAYVSFIWAGLKTRGFIGFFGDQLFPKGLPWPIYIILTPIEAASTFIVRPATLAIRLLCNMMAGHVLLATTFFGTSALLSTNSPVMALGALTGMAAVVVTLFEVMVAVLQAFIFAVLTSVYISLSIHTH